MIYVSTACIKKNSIKEIIQMLAKYGIHNIELSGGTSYSDNIEKELINLKDLYGVRYACHAYFPPPKVPFVINLASCNDAIYQQSINHYTQCIEMLKLIGCRTLSIHAGVLIEIGPAEIGKKLSGKIIYDEKKAYERFCAAYIYIDKLCAENGIKLFLENNVLSAENYKQFKHHNYMMMTDYDSIMKMKKELDFKLLLDLGHLHVSANTLGLDYSRECGLLAKHIKWIHISENNGISDEHKPLTKGSVIMEEFYKIYNPSINVTLETIGDIEEILASAEMLKEQ